MLFDHDEDSHSPASRYHVADKLGLTALSQFILVALHKFVEILGTIKARASVYLEQRAYSQFV